MKNSMELKCSKHPQALYYAALLFVIVVWSITPVVNPYIYKHISPSICNFISGLVAVLSLIPIVGKRFLQIDKKFLRIAIPTGIINSGASLLQKIGLLYTTPSRYAFLENLSCVVVPILMYVFIRKKPSVLKLLSAILCLFGCFLLSGGGITDGGIGIGDVLCACAGILYGVNIATTAAFAKNIYAPLYVMIHMIIHTLTSAVTTIVLSNIQRGGVPITPIYFKWNLYLILLIAAIAVLSNTICWVIRTNVLKHLDATVVAIMMPFSAVITGILSVILGQEPFSFSLAVGGGVILLASIISGLGDVERSDPPCK